jgi:hypothetical protein
LLILSANYNSVHSGPEMNANDYTRSTIDAIYREMSQVHIAFSISVQIKIRSIVSYLTEKHTLGYYNEQLLLQLCLGSEICLWKWAWYIVTLWIMVVTLYTIALTFEISAF